MSAVQGLKTNVSQILSSFLFMMGVKVQVQKHYSIMAENRIALSNSFLKGVILKYPYGINFSPMLKIIKVLNITISVQVTLILSLYFLIINFI